MEKGLAYKEEIEGFREVAETVRVVEQSAAAQIHLLKKQVAVLVEYMDVIEIQLRRLMLLDDHLVNPLLEKQTLGDMAIVVVAGEEGIVGGLYHGLVSRLMQDKNNYQQIFTIGKKAHEYLIEEGVKAHQVEYSGDILEAMAGQKISGALMNRFLSHELRRLDVIFPNYISLAEQQPVLVPFLPFDLAGRKSGFMPSKRNSIESDGWPIFEPSHEVVFELLLKKYINVFFTEVVLETKLCEFAARTVAAEQAVVKTEELMANLRVSFLKERRNLVTQKQLESFIAHKTV